MLIMLITVRQVKGLTDLIIHPGLINVDFAGKFAFQYFALKTCARELTLLRILGS
jgi:hypothetical protein